MKTISMESNQTLFKDINTMISNFKKELESGCIDESIGNISYLTPLYNDFIIMDNYVMTYKRMIPTLEMMDKELTKLGYDSIGSVLYKYYKKEDYTGVQNNVYIDIKKSMTYTDVMNNINKVRNRYNIYDKFISIKSINDVPYTDSIFSDMTLVEFSTFELNVCIFEIVNKFSRHFNISDYIIPKNIPFNNLTKYILISMIHEIRRYVYTFDNKDMELYKLVLDKWDLLT